MRHSYLLLLISCIFLINACTKEATTNDGRLSVGVTLAPQAWLANNIGKDQIKVTTLLAPGDSPETFDPSPKDIATIFKANLFFVAGFEFERHIIEKMAAKSQTVMIDPAESLPLRHFNESEAHHHHGEANEDHHHHHDGGIDPHFWFSTRHMRHHAKIMAEAMSKAKPEQASFFNENLQNLYKILDQLDSEAQNSLGQYKNRAFLVFHPTYGYLAEEYNLEQVAIEVEGKEPTPKQLTEITSKAQEHHITTIIVQPQFSRSAAQAIANSIKGEVVVVDSLSGNYEEMFRHLITTLANSFKNSADKASHD